MENLRVSKNSLDQKAWFNPILMYLLKLVFKLFIFYKFLILEFMSKRIKSHAKQDFKLLKHTGFVHVFTLCHENNFHKHDLNMYRTACLTATCPSYKNFNVKLQHFANTAITNTATRAEQQLFLYIHIGKLNI